MADERSDVEQAGGTGQPPPAGERITTTPEGALSSTTDARAPERDEPDEPSSEDKPAREGDGVPSTPTANPEPNKERKKNRNKKKTKKNRESHTALIGVAGTLLGGIVAGAFGLWTNNADRSGEAERSQHNFIRAQRVAAYTAFATGFNALDQAFGDKQLAIEGAYPGVIVLRGRPSKYDVDTSYSNLWNAFNSLEFVGSAEAEDAALKVAQKATDIKEYFASWDFDHPDPAKLRSAIPTDSIKNEQTAFDTESRCMLVDLEIAAQKFNDAGRGDLGIDRLPQSGRIPPPSGCPPMAH